MTNTNRPAAPRRAPSPRSLFIGGVALLMIGLVLASALGRGGEQTVRGTDVTDTQLVALGQTVYRARCASCHGANLEGQPNWQQRNPDGSMPAPPHDVSGHTWHHNDQSLFATVKQGGQATAPPGYPNTMPAFGGVLSDTEIWAVLSYIKSTWPPEVQAMQERGHN
ncbi:MAG: cytochrome c [Roseiflexaceae bacterium]